jgi:hypothetical protein
VRSTVSYENERALAFDFWGARFYFAILSVGSRFVF